MNYFLDTEFDGPGGTLLSMALVREDGYSFYATMHTTFIQNEWVAYNVLPLLYAIPENTVDEYYEHLTPEMLTVCLYNFFKDDTDLINIVADWPEDFVYFCRAIQTGPGTMIGIPAIGFLMHRCEPWPNDIPGAVQHNAYWDAMALKHLFSTAQPTSGGSWADELASDSGPPSDPTQRAGDYNKDTQ